MKSCTQSFEDQISAMTELYTHIPIRQSILMPSCSRMKSATLGASKMAITANEFISPSPRIFQL